MVMNSTYGMLKKGFSAFCHGRFLIWDTRSIKRIIFVNIFFTKLGKNKILQQNIQRAGHWSNGLTPLLSFKLITCRQKCGVEGCRHAAKCVLF